MKKENSRNIRVGLFVIVGTVFIISALYFIGDKKNLFSSKFTVYADFQNVSGLMPGNNVRFGGINVGTVESIEIINDTSIRVTMFIKEKTHPFIKKNSIAQIGTDGLMGNRLVNITSSKIPGPLIEDGDVLFTKQLFETDEMVRILGRTNQDVSIIAKNLKEITNKLNNENGIWNILNDPELAQNFKQALVNIKFTSERTAIITGDLSSIIDGVQSGKGTLGALITDTTMSTMIRQSIVKIKFASDTMAYITGDLRSVSKKIRNGDGAVGTLLMDTTFVHNLNESMENIRKGSQSFNENMEALKKSLLLRKYFKKQEEKNKE